MKKIITFTILSLVSYNIFSNPKKDVPLADVELAKEEIITVKKINKNVPEKKKGISEKKESLPIVNDENRDRYISNAIELMTNAIQQIDDRKIVQCIPRSQRDCISSCLDENQNLISCDELGRFVEECHAAGRLCIFNSNIYNYDDQGTCNAHKVSCSEGSPIQEPSSFDLESLSTFWEEGREEYINKIYRFEKNKSNFTKEAITAYVYCLEENSPNLFKTDNPPASDMSDEVVSSCLSKNGLDF